MLEGDFHLRPTQLLVLVFPLSSDSSDSSYSSDDTSTDDN